MGTNKPMSVAEAGRLGIKSSIKKYGINGHRKRCSDAGRARLHKMTKAERSRVARMAVAARIFYNLFEDGREKWEGMSESQRNRWFLDHMESRNKNGRRK